MAHRVDRLPRYSTNFLNKYAGPAGELLHDIQTDELVLQNGNEGGVRFANKPYVEQAITKHKEDVDKVIKKIQDTVDKLYTNKDEDSGGVIDVSVSADESISDALKKAFTDYYPVYLESGMRVRLMLAPGFKMKEQIVIDNINCGFITIKANATKVSVDCSAFTQQDTEKRYPLFYVLNGGVSPIIDALFEIPSASSYSGVAERVAGFTASFGGTILLAPGSGILNAERGCSALYGGHIICTLGNLTTGNNADQSTRGVQLSNTRGRAIFASHHGFINMPRTVARYAGAASDYTVYGIWGSVLNIYQGDFSHAAYTAVYIRDGSICCARETNVSYAGYNGFHALHSARIDARWHDNAITSEGAVHCTQHAVIATYGSHVDASTLPCDYCTGTASVYASEGSLIVITDGTSIIGKTDTSRRGLFALRGGIIVAFDAILSGYKVAAIICESGGRVYAPGAQITNGRVWATEGSYIDVMGSKVVMDTSDSLMQAAHNADGDVAWWVVTGRYGSSVLCTNATIIGGKRQLNAMDASVITATGVNLIEATERAISCISGTVMAGSCTITRAAAHSTNLVHCSECGRVSIFRGTFNTPEPSIKLLDGGNWVNAVDLSLSSGTTLRVYEEVNGSGHNATVNAISQAGIVFA